MWFDALMNLFLQILFTFTIIFFGSVIFVLCWNYCIPVLFGLPEITWLQSICLVFIAKILFPNKITFQNNKQQNKKEENNKKK